MIFVGACGARGELRLRSVRREGFEGGGGGGGGTLGGVLVVVVHGGKDGGEGSESIPFAT
jgi:hypothetical protein